MAHAWQRSGIAKIFACFINYIDYYLLNSRSTAKSAAATGISTLVARLSLRRAAGSRERQEVLVDVRGIRRI
jgi:hypothetical protein